MRSRASERPTWDGVEIESEARLPKRRPFVIGLHSSPPYRHRRLESNKIRLFLIVKEKDGKMGLRLRHFEVDDSTIEDLTSAEYNALSYCWGNQQNLCRVEVKDGAREGFLWITKSLYRALEVMHDSPPNRASFWWIDQICIDQKNLEERNKQVQTMWKVYSSARRVCAWLGEDDALELPPTDGTEADLRRSISPAPEDRDALAPDSPGSGWDPQGGCFDISESLVKNVMMIADQPYFTRTWIVPEILQAKDLVFFFYDGRPYPIQELRMRIDLLIRSGWKYDVHKLVAINNLLQVQSGRQIPGVLKRERTDRSAFLSALQLLHDTECLDIRDKVFAALSIPTLTDREGMRLLRPDYGLSRDELVVTVLHYFDQLQGTVGRASELSRTISRSLKLGNGENSSSAYEAAVVASVSACTQPWVEGQELCFKFGVSIGEPGHWLRYYLSRGHHTGGKS